MDFIERIFGLAPDNGDGSLERLYLLLPALALLAATYLLRSRRDRQRNA